jgi:hypothetical protein
VTYNKYNFPPKKNVTYGIPNVGFVHHVKHKASLALGSMSSMKKLKCWGEIWSQDHNHPMDISLQNIIFFQLNQKMAIIFLTTSITT